MPSFDCMQIRVADSQSRTPGWVSNLGARALLLMRGLSAALEPLRTSRRGHQQRATRVGLARIVQQRRGDRDSGRARRGFSRPPSDITRMSSPGFQWRVRGLVRAALLDDFGQTNACCALLVTPKRCPERLEGCAQPPHQQERTRPEVAGSARHQAAATRSESVKSTDRGKYIENRLI